MDPNLKTSSTTTSSINQHNSLNKASDYVLNIYDKVTYSDLYGSSVLIVIIATIVIILAITFSMLIQNKEEVADDWPNYRCKPLYIPFAGYIVPEEGKTAGQTTYENFQYCLQQEAVNLTADATNSQVYLLSALNTTFAATAEAANNLRHGMTELRNNTRVFVEDLFHRIMNILDPILKIFLAIKDVIAKLQGILAAAMFVFDGAFKTIQAYIGAFFQMVVISLVIQIAIIIALYALPFTIPVAISLGIPVAAFAVLFSIIAATTAKMFNIKSVNIPRIKWGGHKCFDKNTLFTMNDGETKKIIDVKAGDILADGTKVTAKFKLDTYGSRMFSLGGVIVSDSHIVKYSDKWICVSEHCEAIEIHGYNEPYIYCLNTSSKEIILNGLQLLDWDDLHDVSLEKVLNKIDSRNLFDIHRKLDKGFAYDFEVELLNENKKICDVKNGDKLKTGGTVYGVVEIDGTDLSFGDKLYDDKLYDDNKLYHLLSTNKKFSSNGKVINDYNDIIDAIV